MQKKFKKDNDLIILFWLKILDFEKYVKSLSKKFKFEIDKDPNVLKKKNVVELLTLEEDKEDDLRDYSKLVIDDFSERDLD